MVHGVTSVMRDGMGTVKQLSANEVRVAINCCRGGGGGGGGDGRECGVVDADALKHL